MSILTRLWLASYHISFATFFLVLLQKGSLELEEEMQQTLQAKVCVKEEGYESRLVWLGKGIQVGAESRVHILKVSHNLI